MLSRNEAPSLRSSASPNPWPQQDPEQGGDGLASSAPSTGERADTSAATTDIFDDGLVTLDRAEHLMNIYRSNMATHFPFVVVSQSISVQELRNQKPFLFLSLLVSASFHDTVLQRSLGFVLKRTISNRLLYGKGLTFEVLQGLLVFLAWYALFLGSMSCVLNAGSFICPLA